MKKFISQSGATVQEILLAVFGATLCSVILLATHDCSDPDPATGMTCSEEADNAQTDVYFIVDSGDFNDQIWSTTQQDPETVRWNVAHTQFIVKYNVIDIPRDQVGNDLPLHNPKTHQEIIEILQTPEWSPTDIATI